jgi:hypothetical protein
MKRLPLYMVAGLATLAGAIPTIANAVEYCTPDSNGNCVWSTTPPKNLPSFDQPAANQAELSATVYRSNLNTQFNVMWEAGVAVGCKLRSHEWGKLVVKNADNTAFVLAQKIWPAQDNVISADGRTQFADAKAALLNQYSQSMAQKTDPADCQALGESVELGTLDQVAALVAEHGG